SYTVTSPDSISIDLQATPVLVAGGNDGMVIAAVTGGTMPYQYLWSNGDTTPVITDLVSDYYFVTVTDVNGCAGVSSVFVSQPSCGLEIFTTVSHVTCYDNSDGTAHVTYEGANDVSILWS